MKLCQPQAARTTAASSPPPARGVGPSTPRSPGGLPRHDSGPAAAGTHLPDRPAGTGPQAV